VVFSSGFFGFYAHAGFLSAIREWGIEPTGYAGSSSGAILAAMGAAGMSDDDIRKILFNLKKSDFWDPESLPWILMKALRRFKGYTGFLKGKGFERLLNQLPVRTFEECAVPAVIVATDLSLQKEAVFTRGDLIKAVHASGAVPMLFKPVEMNGSFYVDGGLVNKAPVQPLSERIHTRKMIVHFITSKNLKGKPNRFLSRKWTPWQIHSLAVNIARKEAYQRQCDIVRNHGIEIIEVRTDTPAVGPNRLDRGTMAYRQTREATLKFLKENGLTGKPG